MKRRSNETKLIMETWRRFINEDASMDMDMPGQDPYPGEPEFLDNEPPVDEDLSDMHMSNDMGMPDDMSDDDMGMSGEYDDMEMPNDMSDDDVGMSGEYDDADEFYDMSDDMTGDDY